jgi:hypothetical protein
MHPGSRGIAGYPTPRLQPCYGALLNLVTHERELTERVGLEAGNLFTPRGALRRVIHADGSGRTDTCVPPPLLQPLDRTYNHKPHGVARALFSFGLITLPSSTAFSSINVGDLRWHCYHSSNCLSLTYLPDN